MFKELNEAIKGQWNFNIKFGGEKVSILITPMIKAETPMAGLRINASPEECDEHLAAIIINKLAGMSDTVVEISDLQKALEKAKKKTTEEASGKKKTTTDKKVDSKTAGVKPLFEG